MSNTRFKVGDPYTIECARKGAAAGGHYVGSPKAKAAGKKGRMASPWGRVPFNRNAKRTLRLEAIKRAARKSL